CRSGGANSKYRSRRVWHPALDRVRLKSGTTKKAHIASLDELACFCQRDDNGTPTQRSLPCVPWLHDLIGLEYMLAGLRHPKSEQSGCCGCPRLRDPRAVVGAGNPYVRAFGSTQHVEKAVDCSFNCGEVGRYHLEVHGCCGKVGVSEDSLQGQ